MSHEPTTFDSYHTHDTINTADGPATYFSLQRLKASGFPGIDALPYSLRILLETLLRNEDGVRITAEDIKALASHDPSNSGRGEIPFMPARVVLQDFTGVPAVVDLAAMPTQVRSTRKSRLIWSSIIASRWMPLPP